jgi:hypothetical protein
MQDVDRPAHIERLSQPTRARRPRVQVKSGRLVPHSERLDRIVGNRWWKWYVGQQPSVRSAEPQVLVVFQSSTRWSCCRVQTSSRSVNSMTCTLALLV